MSPVPILTSIVFQHYKGLSSLVVHLQDVNILVGPNNCGKSTIIGALRILSEGLRHANAKNPSLVQGPSGPTRGYDLAPSALPVSLENVHTNYVDSDSSVRFKFSNGSELLLFFPASGGCHLIPRSERLLATVAAFRRAFPISIGVVPILGPAEHNELLVTEQTVRENLYSHRASRHFRSYWYYNPPGFDSFAEMVRQTWPGMEIMPPEHPRSLAGHLVMFCKENRIDREIYWAGFGFQVWCQLLTHVSRSTHHSMLVIDEPEVYLHPDVQRQLVGLLRSAGPMIVAATHSTEIMGEADPAEVILVDKSRPVARRLRDIDEVQAALDNVGSIQNITLTQLARTGRVLFVEGDTDFPIIRQFAKRLGFAELAAASGVSCVQSGGFSTWQRVRDTAWGIEKTLGRRLAIAAVLDRDYRSEDEMLAIETELKRYLSFVCLLKRKEIENYMLVPAALQRAIERGVTDRAQRTGESTTTVASIMDELAILTDAMKTELQGQYVARRTDFLKGSGKDSATIAAETLAWFDQEWATVDRRLAIVPGKRLLRDLRQRVQQQYAVTLTDARIIQAMRRDEVHLDLTTLVEALDGFRAKSPNSTDFA